MITFFLQLLFVTLMVRIRAAYACGRARQRGTARPRARDSARQRGTARDSAGQRGTARDSAGQRVRVLCPHPARTPPAARPQPAPSGVTAGTRGADVTARL